MTTGISAALALSLLAVTSLAFDMKEIVPGRKVAAQIGKELVLSCRTSGCAVAPTFLWSAQLDNPLGGTVHQEGNNSFLTMKPVTFANAHQYTCTATCGEDKRQKKVRVDVYSFPDNPVIEISSQLVLGKQAEVTCIIPHVYPSDRLEVSLKIGEKLIDQREFVDPDTHQSLQTKSLRALFTPAKGDIGQDITCIAELPINDMEFEPKKRQTTHRLNIAVFSTTPPSTISASTTPLSTITSSTTQPSTISTSTAPPSTISSSTTPSSTISTSTTQPSTISSSTTQPSTISTSATQPSTISSTTPPSTISTSTTQPSTISSSTTAPSTISSSTTPPSTISTSTYQPEHSTEKEDFTIPSTPYSAPHQKEDETSTAAKGTNFMYRTLQNDATYAVSVADDITSGTEEVIIIARKEELDYLTTGVIVAASLVTVAGPVAAILLYISRKTKINGSYSIVNSPEAKV